MKTNISLLLLFVIVTYQSCAVEKKYNISIEKKYDISIENSITIQIADNNELKFIISNFGKPTEYKFGIFPSDTTLLNEKKFIVAKQDRLEVLFDDFLVTADSLIFISMADWNDKPYIFSFKKSGGNIFPLLLKNGKIQELFVTRLPYVYYNEKCNVLIRIDREIGEYYYKNATKEYFDVVIYNLNDVNDEIESNILRLDSSLWDFYGELTNSDSPDFFKNVFEQIDTFLKLCK